MNKDIVLNWLLQDAEGKGDHYYKQRIKLEDALYELNNRREITLPSSLPDTPKKMIPVLRKHFKDNVTFISLILNYYFPEQYLFYRVSKLEEEIFEGLEFFSEITPEFKFKFPNVGRKGFDRYLNLNETLLNFAHSCWPKHKKLDKRVMHFLYEGLGKLFLDESDYHRYWVVATQEQYFDGLDVKEKVVSWSGRKEMQPGDWVFVYRTTPRRAITDILRVKDEPFFDPWGAWDGFWMNLEKVCVVEDIPFAEMKQDPIIGRWGTVRKHFQGTVTEPIPHIIYNELLNKIDETIRTKHNLEPESISSAPKVVSKSLSHPPTIATPQYSGQFTSEAEFEEEVIIPLLKGWKFRYERQYPCPFRVGSQYHRGKVDFYVSDEKGPVILFEDKLQIRKNEDLEPAVEQAKSYALLLGLPSFIVASPEGLWLYSLNRNEENLVESISTEEITHRNQEEVLKDLFMRLRQ